MSVGVHVSVSSLFLSQLSCLVAIFRGIRPRQASYEQVLGRKYFFPVALRIITSQIVFFFMVLVFLLFFLFFLFLAVYHCKKKKKNGKTKCSYRFISLVKRLAAASFLQCHVI